MTYFSIDDEEEPVPREEDLEEEERREASHENLEDTETDEPSGAKKIVYWLCGINSFIKNKNKLPQTDFKIDTSIDENPTLKKICDVNAVLAMAFCGFCYGFFNKYS